MTGSAASPEASAALLAVPKTQQMTFPKRACRGQFLFTAALASRNQSSTDSEPTLSASAPKAGSALSVMTPWPFVSAMWQLSGACAMLANPDQFRAVDNDNGTRPDLLLVGIQERLCSSMVPCLEPRAQCSAETS